MGYKMSPPPVKFRNCSVCGKLFKSTWRSNVCDECKIKLLDKEKEIIDFVSENPNMTIVEVAEHCNVSPDFVRRMVEEGKFSEKTTNMNYPCRGCGTPIAVGTFCQKCLVKLKTQLDAARANIIANMNSKGKSVPKVATTSARSKSTAPAPKSKTTLGEDLRNTVIKELANKSRNMFSDGFASDKRKK